MNPPKEANPLSDAETPVIKVVGKVAAGDDQNDGSGAKYLLHCGWTRKTFQVSNRGLKVVRGLDIKVIDNPDEYDI